MEERQTCECNSENKVIREMLIFFYQIELHLFVLLSLRLASSSHIAWSSEQGDMCPVSVPDLPPVWPALPGVWRSRLLCYCLGHFHWRDEAHLLCPWRGDHSAHHPTWKLQRKGFLNFKFFFLVAKKFWVRTDVWFLLLRLVSSTASAPWPVITLSVCWVSGKESASCWRPDTSSPSRSSSGVRQTTTWLWDVLTAPSTSGRWTQVRNFQMERRTI